MGSFASARQLDKSTMFGAHYNGQTNAKLEADWQQRKATFKSVHRDNHGIYVLKLDGSCFPQTDGYKYVKGDFRFHTASMTVYYKHSNKKPMKRKFSNFPKQIKLAAFIHDLPVQFN